MSVEVASEHVCYVHCNFCNTVLADYQNLKEKSQDEGTEYGSSSKHGRIPMTSSAENGQYQMLPIRPPEKRQRVPSAYNRFIKEEIQRIKASNPDISHREAFSAAAKNWAHFPYIHFGLNLDNRKQVNSNEAIASEGAPKSHGYY